MYRVAFVLLLSGCLEYDLTEEPPDVEDPIDTAVEEDPIDTGEPIAEAPVYANTSTDLYEVVPATGMRSHIGSFRDAWGAVEGMIDIAIDLEGHMYGGTYEALYRIDPTTAAVTKVCDLDVEMTALAFTSAGQLIAGGYSDITKIDVGSCSWSYLVHGSDYETSGDIVGLPDGKLYWTIRGNGDGDQLVRVDPANGSQTWVGVIGAEKLYGVGYHEGELYGFGSDGVIVRISPGNAQSELLQADDSISWWGATTNPVVW